MDWVASGGKGAVVLDWMTAAPKLATLTCIVCDRESLAPKVDRMVSRYRPRPKLRVLSWGE
ncbi:MAG: hypothetical protein O3C49_10790, partial [Proteobacteria bacterium]|nr:hypothetical protein [Pseudomonadota bacterium]